MAGLQEYSGRGKDGNRKTFYRMQPYLNGRRVTIRLGDRPKKAEASCKAINDLIDSKEVDVLPDPKTQAWVRDLATKATCRLLHSNSLISELPARFTSGKEDDNVVLISKLADDYIETRGAGQSAGTIEVYHKAKRNLISCLGDVDVTTVKPPQAREFWRWLLKEGNSKTKKGSKLGLSVNTAKQRLRYARAFFEQAVEDELIRKNPFKIKGLTTAQSAAEKEYVPTADVDKVIEKCTSTEWKLLFAMVRSIPMRIPSEIQELTWTDVDWA